MSIFAVSPGMNSRSPIRRSSIFVFTLCDKAAKEDCPAWPGQPMTANWGMPDPVAAKGTPEEIERAFVQAFSELRRRINVFLSLPFPVSIPFLCKRSWTTLARARN